MSTLIPIFSMLMVTFLVLRIFVFRPHWLGNLITMTVLVVYTFMMADGTIPSDGTLGVIMGCAVITFLAHLIAKRRDKKKLQKKTKKTTKAQPAKKPVAQPVKPPTHVPTQKPAKAEPVKAEPVVQTLTSCMRCSQPLQGPKCHACGFDHTAQPILLLSPVVPNKLQIRIDQQ